MTFKNVQGLRAVAVLMVILAHVHDFTDRLHVPNALAALLPIGTWGVDLFFTISGFIMVVVHWKDFGRAGTPKRFLIKRIARIFPLYWSVTLVLLVALHTVPGLTHHWMGASANLPASLLLLPQTGGSLLFVAWTLTYEMYFYYVFAVLLRLRRSFAFRALAIWGGVIAAMQLVPAALGNPYTAVLFGNVVLEFIAGALVGAAVVRARILPPLQTLAVGLLALGVTFGLTMHYGLHATEGSLRFVFVGIPMAAIVYGAVGFEIAERRVVPAALQSIGDASYSIYLWHTILFAAFARLLGGHLAARIPVPVLLVLVPCAVVFASILLYHAIEVPLTTWSRDLARKLYADTNARGRQVTSPLGLLSPGSG